MSITRNRGNMDNPPKELQNNFVWLFNSNLRVGLELPSGVFLTKENAQKWIDELGLKGLLTPYPIDISVYDWAIQNQFFTPQVSEHYSPAFIASFISNYYRQYLEWVEQKIVIHTKTDTINEMNTNGPESLLGEGVENLTFYPEVWVYTANIPRNIGLASAVFLTKETAEKWVEELGIEGLLTVYPVDISAYDWAVQNKWFTPKKPHHYSPEFIGTFTGGHKHFHYVDVHESGQLEWR